MKKRKSLKVRLIVPILMSVILAMGILLIFSNTNFKNNTGTMISNTMYDLIESCNTTTELYMDYVEQISINFSQMQSVKNVLKNPNDIKSIRAAQQDTISFASEIEGIEGLYIAKYDSTVLTHNAIDKIIGVTLRSGESLVQLQNSLNSAQGVYNDGISISKGDGQTLVVNTFYLIKDDGGKPLGYIGCAFYVEDYIEKVKSVATHTFNESNVAMINTRTNTYMYNENPELIGTESNIDINRQQDKIL